MLNTLRSLFASLFSATLLVVSATSAFAADEFTTSISSNYIISPDGIATVEQQVSLTNQLSDIYASQYTFEIGSNRLESISARTASGKKIPITSSIADGHTTIVLSFPDQIVGKGQTNQFTITYKNFDVAQHVGNVLEVLVPRLQNSFDLEQYQVNISVPKQFGPPKLVSPNTYQSTSTGSHTNVSFSRDAIKDSGILAIFGENQVFDFSLTYHVENSGVSPALAQVALPPDTPYQKIFLDRFSHPPHTIDLDADGNWIATFKLEPDEVIPITVTGKAIVYLEPNVAIPSQPPDPSSYLVDQPYWPVNDPEIKQLAQSLTTPRDIYDYLVDNFTYNYDRINNRPQRQGAKQALAAPDNTICTDFTDSFVTLARANGIPAREITGYGYTENSQLKPLSLVADVLHSWAEYYDQDTQRWIPIDPTWGNTTGGINYFDQLDFNHLTLAIHGQDSEIPYAAGYYKLKPDSKDVDVTFSDDLPQPRLNLSTTLKPPKSIFFNPHPTYTLTLRSTSNIALYNQTLNLTSDDIDIVDSQVRIPSLLPFSEITIPVQLGSSQHPRPSITFTIGDYTQTQYVDQATFTRQDFIYIALAVGLGIGCTILTYATGRLLVSRRKK